ncbi:acyltransferase domain-containing protein, partial [Streptomyces sp. NPDC089915]|uniref:acyltransferase domain-containing protein n=1 Tax=Streptomyces sp. NPDC089915 TaxID=3155186 RepID=UPI00343AF0CB
VICARSKLLATVSGGAMASVLLDEDAVLEALESAGADGVVPAVLTSPASTVVSGDAGQIAALVATWEAQGVTARVIDVDVASHSPAVDPVLPRLAEALAEVPAASWKVPFYSTVTADPRQPGIVDGGYWVRNQRAAVRFRHAVDAALADGHRVFVECTAHPLAVRPILDTARAANITDLVAVGTLRQDADDHDAFLGHLGRLHCAGLPVDWAAHYGDGELVPAPTIAWDRRRHGGDETPYRLVPPNLVGAGQHPLLGGHVHDPDRPGRHLWQTPISPARVPWLADHRVSGVPVMPGTGFVEMMLAAAAEALATPTVAARDVRVLAPLVLDPEPTVTTHLTVTAEGTTVEIRTHDADRLLR